MDYHQKEAVSNELAKRLANGLAKDRAEEKKEIEVAKRFLKMHLPFEQIVKATRLSKEEIENLKESNKMKKNKTAELIKILQETYPEASCSLNFKTPFELVVAVMLSAQCTDERVNITTPKLFERCKSVEDFANIDLTELEDLIHPCGFYHNKANNIKLCAKQILEKYNGKVPCDIDSLTSLAGVGRKSANVIMLEVFGIAEGIAVDTHCKRISNRIGLSEQSDPLKIEKDLLKQFTKPYLKDVNHLFVWHGRYTCTARNPKCETCTIKNFCNYFKKN